MNADQHGTPAEQKRAKVKWLGAGMRQSDPTYVPNRRCKSCRHCSRLVSYRCQRHGFTTVANAVCDDFHVSVCA